MLFNNAKYVPTEASHSLMHCGLPIELTSSPTVYMWVCMQAPNSLLSVCMKKVRERGRERERKKERGRGGGRERDKKRFK